jgi:small subunit ribosomal protein S6
MQLYEATYLIEPNLSNEDIKSLQERIKSWVEEEKGSLTKAHPPVQKELAYPIKKKTTAFMASLTFDLDPPNLQNLEKKIKEEPTILRYLILKKEPEKLTGKTAPRRKPKPSKTKVELEEIEKKLEEILGEKPPQD